MCLSGVQGAERESPAGSGDPNTNAVVKVLMFSPIRYMFQYL